MIIKNMKYSNIIAGIISILSALFFAFLLITLFIDGSALENWVLSLGLLIVTIISIINSIFAFKNNSFSKWFSLILIILIFWSILIIRNLFRPAF